MRYRRQFCQLVSFLLLAMFSVACQSQHVTRVYAKDGKLDLSKHDFSQGPVEIRGDWKFYWGQFIDSAELTNNGAPKPDTYFSTIGDWSQLENPNQPGMTYPSMGYASYLLEVDLPYDAIESSSTFAAGILRGWDRAKPHIIDRQRGTILANKLWGKPAARAGEERIAFLALQHLDFNPKPHLYLLIHTSNHLTPNYGGLYQPLLLGTQKDVIGVLRSKNQTMAAVFGLIFIVALNHLILFCFSNADRASFWFAALSFDLAIRVLVEENLFINTQNDSGALSELLYRASFSTWYLTIPFVSLLMWNLFPRPKETWILMALSFIGFSCTAFAIVAPIPLIAQLQTFFELVTLGMIIWVISLIARGLRGSQKIESAIILSGFLSLAGAAVFDIFMTVGGDAPPMAQWGMVLMVLSQSVVISYRRRLRRRQNQEAIAEKSLSLERELGARQQLEGALSEIEGRLSESHHQLQKAETLLLQAQRMSTLGELVASIGHEINNPVQQFGFAVDIIENETKNIDSSLHELIPNESQEAKAIIEMYERRLESLYEQIEVGRLVTDRLKDLGQALRNGSRSDGHPINDVDINKVLNEAVTIVSGKIKIYDLQLDFGNIATIRCKPSHIGQIFINLLSNSADAINEMNEKGSGRNSGSIRIATQVENRDGTDGVLINVEDSGPGIPIEIRDKVLEAFFTTKGTDKGTGLGLAISRKIVSSHDGHLAIDQSPDLGGARISVWLPQSSVN